MGRYRATLNMAEAKRGQVVELPDDEPRIARMVRDGHLVPVDVDPEVMARIEDAKNKPTPVAANSVEAVRRVLEERRRAAGIVGGVGSSVSTAVPVVAETAKTHNDVPAAEGVEAAVAEVAEQDAPDDEPSFAGSRPSSGRERQSPPRRKNR